MDSIFKFKDFSVNQDKTAMKIGTDGVLLGAWCTVDFYPDSILDIGSGTGVVALMLAQRSDAMTIDAVELDENAYEQSVENFEQSDWGDRLYCYNGTFQEFADEIAEEEETYDLVISNPPFYTDDFESQDKARNKARFTSALSFDDLIVGVVKILSKNGKFTTIIPYKEEKNFINLANEKGLFLNRVCQVQGNPTSEIKRSLLEFSFDDIDIKKEHLIIEIERHQYTEDYNNLTKDFYLKM
ncbi:tRNA (adenine-N(6)-)-methyltransferase [Polaribacter reichenbachii]|uniref:tRNA1(Val) (adenine(37)-N6)-methyltransferase n=2 Tax=Polaribacter reichenbachii TaxID=996801 RepID=A0A1B8U775_9FLAO|nr:methyltransferase [Polaribacter reichenbachii]APZ46343.1 tRNA (adenine-N(6)-)-methyltransferase [Polaribacter reichenbachii]AUC20207.1 tRNA (adenine-N(6)-)-methyltransferase [Polaribacter reichenbachii]OBY67702.1 tRNA (adenine-N(6)-)-methyltransferase [Polaribacter reichenbachii]